eukprot:TsM_001176000 transcript=TsM_001176000 gene=TsM_001176000
MLGLIVALLCAARCSGGTGPKLWGSRVVRKPYGVSYPLDYEYREGYHPIVYTSKDTADIYVKCHRCVAFGKYWGSPCEWNKEKASLTMEDNTRQEKIEIIDFSVNRELISITHFVPYCRFPTSKAGIRLSATTKPVQSLYLY